MIIEKVVASRLIHYLELNHLDKPLQSAYKRFHSCETALVRVHNDLLRAVDNRCCAVLLLLDLSAAFDTADNNLLLNRLESQFAIRGKTLQWFKSYFSKRSQFVSIDLDKSSSHELNCGVPPGSVLGPVLYLLHTSPVAGSLRRHNMTFHLYADDTQLYASFSCNDDLGLQRTLSNIEKCLNDIHLWMTANKLKLNKDKTELIYFHSKYSPQTSFIPLNFGADLIQPSQHVRDIGVIFYCTLSMRPQVNPVVKSAFYQLRNIARITKYSSPKTIELLVHAFVSSKLNFCNSLLYGIPKHLLRKRQSVQNAAAPVVTSPKYDHVTPLLMQLHWLPIAERIKFKIVLFNMSS